jgi:hypothetical protein
MLLSVFFPVIYHMFIFNKSDKSLAKFIKYNFYCSQNVSEYGLKEYHNLKQYQAK